MTKITPRAPLDPALLEKLRNDYAGELLDETAVDPNPFHQFSGWFGEAVSGGVHTPNAMTLATTTTEGTPSARIVLLKGLDNEEFVFYTNYMSRKANEMLANPRASLLFFWSELERQVRIDGMVRTASPEEADAYFATRPRASQIGAHASHQSMPVTNRKTLEDAFAEFEKKFEGIDVPRPAHWGGFRLRPALFEFWQGRPSRLHDRITYTREHSGNWTIARISP